MPPGNEVIHEPVLLEETLAFLAVREGGAYLDCTTGTGGHMLAVARLAGPGGAVIGCDLDPAALEKAERRLEQASAEAPIAHWQLIRSSYTAVAELAGRLPGGKADGILFDLGCSSLQLEDPARGFSFSKDGPLDMRFDPDSGLSAADVVASLPEDELARIFRLYGGERRARAVARRIAAEREKAPITTTARLREIVESVTGRRTGRIAGATRVFQALRIYVNSELENVERAIPDAFGSLKEGGTLVIISFHSLEDRIVKHSFKRLEALGSGRILTKKPVVPSQAELRRNPRSRSAKFRAIRKVTS